MTRILMIIPYEFYPPKYGGALRCFYLLRELARYHHVTLLTVQPSRDFASIKSGISTENLEIVPTADTKNYRTIFNILPERVSNAINSRILRRSLFKRGNLYLLKTYPVLKQILAQKNFDFICFENLESFSFLHKIVRRLSPASKLIYDAHNVDSELWLQHHKSMKLPHLLDYANGALSLETQLYKCVDLCFCCSDADKKKLISLNEGRLNAVVIPNGVDCAARPFDENPQKFSIRNILFCGTLDYGPNIEGVMWFYNMIFPLLKEKMPDIRFTVIGKMNKEGPFDMLKKDPSVHFIGYVEDVVPYYRQSSVLIVPLLSGSGTRLKILEAMSLGNPVVSTQIGAEGLRVTNRKDICIADSAAEFANEITCLLDNANFFASIQKNARALVEQQYDWTLTGSVISRSIGQFSSNSNVVNEI